MAELMLRPDLLKRAQEDLDAVVGSNRLVQESDIPNLPFLQAVAKEAFRMHPPAVLSLPRESMQETKLFGYTLPARTRLILNIYAIHRIHRDPSMYEMPEKFNPDRFVDHPDINHISAYDSYQLLPFGMGRRMWPAYNLGNTMVSTLMAQLLHSFDWSLPWGQSVETLDMSESFALTVTKMDALCLIAKPRSPAFLY